MKVKVTRRDHFKNSFNKDISNIEFNRQFLRYPFEVVFCICSLLYQLLRLRGSEPF